MKVRKTNIKIISLIVFIIHLVLYLPFKSIFAQELVSTVKNSSISADSMKIAYMKLRGIKRDYNQGVNPGQIIRNAALYFPRQFMYMMKYASGYGARLINDPKLVDDIENILFNEDKSFGWYPIINMISGFRMRAGVNIFFNYKRIESLFKGKYADKQKYYLEGTLSYQLKKQNTFWRFTCISLTSYDDDLVFYGIGSKPQIDKRSHYLPNPEDDHGIFFQKRWKIQFIAAVKPSPKWEYFFSSSFQKRCIQNTIEMKKTLAGDGDIKRSFNISSLPGMQHDIEQLYNKFSFCYLTWKENTYISPGFKLEGYMGHSFGLGQDESRFIKFGFDLRSHVPVIHENRFVIPRLIFNKIINIGHNIPIPFTEFPDQPAFRGVSDRKLLRLDNNSFLPSIEYQWPLSFNLGGHLFGDYLIVSDRLSHITFDNAPWAIGVGIDFHGLDGELARGQVAYGSEGWAFSFNLGIKSMFSNQND